MNDNNFTQAKVVTVVAEGKVYALDLPLKRS